MKKVYRLTIWSFFEEDQGEDPYVIDYFSMEDALNAREQYSSELLLSGQHAYGVCGPDILEVNDA